MAPKTSCNVSLFYSVFAVVWRKYLLLYHTYVCVPAVFTDDSFPNRPSSKFKAWAMSRLSKFRFLRFSADGITFGESSLASDSEAI